VYIVDFSESGGLIPTCSSGHSSLVTVASLVRFSMISLSDGQHNCSVECNSKVKGASALKCMIVSDCFGLFWIVPLVPCEQEPSHFLISSCDLCNWFLQSLVFACFQVNVEVETA